MTQDNTIHVYSNNTNSLEFIFNDINYIYNKSDGSISGGFMHCKGNLKIGGINLTQKAKEIVENLDRFL